MSDLEKDNESLNLNNLSLNLIQYFDDEIKINKNIETDWKPPKIYGLNNSYKILTHYYQQPGEKILHLFTFQTPTLFYFK